jgi:hypothetical protein
MQAYNKVTDRDEWVVIIVLALTRFAPTGSMTLKRDDAAHDPLDGEGTAGE